MRITRLCGECGWRFEVETEDDPGAGVVEMYRHFEAEHPVALGATPLLLPPPPGQ